MLIDQFNLMVSEVEEWKQRVRGITEDPLQERRAKKGA
jgi:hypothetical protein